ncbi:YkgJ family cysteine cluster protein [Desulfovibrio sp. ZJ200]|uniref:YkgJ family cysteine cluster protein n=1 Tax=Desulfovibrio sp. ZJ200 TaxID=2709792 RepID=UPI0013E9F19D|nr:YkgJ family cysteine cluster protein [Desulfovibrio sp. ZJ200]
MVVWNTETVFACRMCGRCCEGRGGIVVGPADLARLCAFLNLAADEVIARYGERSNGKLKIRSGEDDRCIFFRQGQGCGVHEAKPAICRAWPFFRGNLEDPASLALAKKFCPGIAPEVEHAVFSRLGRGYLRAHGLIANDPSCEANALILK